MTTPERLQELAAAAEPRANLSALFLLSPGPGVTELLLIRHGQVEASDMAEDLHLTPLGHEQAQLLAEYMAASTKLDAVYASPTLRARETAAPLAQAFGLAVETVDALRDVETLRSFDRPFQAMLAEEFGEENVDASLSRIREQATLDAMAPFVQSSKSFRQRIIPALEALIERHPGERVAVVCHGPVIMSYILHLLGSPKDFALMPSLTSITRILARNGQRTVDYINARPHFGV